MDEVAWGQTQTVSWFFTCLTGQSTLSVHGKLLRFRDGDPIAHGAFLRTPHPNLPQRSWNGSHPLLPRHEEPVFP
jgi:hypothetical protein